MSEAADQGTVSHMDLAAEIVSAYVSSNHIQPAELNALITSVHAAISGLGKNTAPAAPSLEKPTPAQIKKSVTPDALISFIDGKSYKALKRHLSGHGLEPHTYRQRYGLPPDYPMVAASYSEARSAISRAIGLGRKPSADRTTEVTSTLASPRTSGRRKKAEAIA